MRQSLMILFLIGSFGCKSSSWGPYTSPRVTGRVVEAGTDAPLSGVTVRRGPFLKNPGQARGGERMVEPYPTRTGAMGEFEFPSERALTILRPSGWNTVRLRFECAGYELSQTNLVDAAVTNTPAGEPWIQVGDVKLSRKAPR